MTADFVVRQFEPSDAESVVDLRNTEQPSVEPSNYGTGRPAGPGAGAIARRLSRNHRPASSGITFVRRSGTTHESDRPLALGDFRLIRELGRGGMGVVYQAEQLSLGRRVAVKVLPFAALLDKRQLERFKNEARAAAMLKHANIVSVYSVGCERGLHFYAMKLVEGLSLAHVIEGMRSDECGMRSAELASAELGVTQKRRIGPHPGPLIRLRRQRT